MGVELKYKTPIFQFTFKKALLKELSIKTRVI